MTTRWPDSIVDEVISLWASGHSAQQIAVILGVGLSRCAVGAKIDRLRKLRGEEVVPRRLDVGAAQNRNLLSGRSQYRRLDLPIDPVVDDVLVAERKTLVALGDTDCRWPIGDPRESDFHFCGRPKVQGLPYCEPHVRRAHQPPDVGPPVAGGILAADGRTKIEGGVAAMNGTEAAPAAPEREREDA